MKTIVATNERADGPKGAPFLVDSFPFRFGEQIDFATVDLDEDKVLDWPMVYILANEDSAYVGQTTSVATRMSQHGANEERRDFKTATVIYHDEFNASVITDYEHRLIGLMQADGKYRLTNKNEGMTRSNYFSKSVYERMFADLWEELRDMDLASHTIAQIEESEVFKYSPYKGLTADQRVALDKIMAAVSKGVDRADPIVVEGMPGTGKTVLAIYLLKMLKDKPEFSGWNIKLVEPVTSLRETLRRTLANVSGLGKADVIGPADLTKEAYGYRTGEEKCFDIVLVDEAHRLKQRVNLGTQFRNHDEACKKLGLPIEATQMDWVLSQAKLAVFFYDPLQAVGPSCIGADKVRSALGSAVDRPIRLDSQMRVKGGRDYLEYVSDILDGRDPDPRSFVGYEFVLHDSPEEFRASFEETIAKHTLTRMIAGYAWKWATKNDKSPGAFDIELGSVGFKWNCTYENWVGKGVDNSSVAREVGCIHSIQGYDLSYAYVIIGNDIVLDQDTGLLRANKASYFDRNGKATATQEELTQYIKNIYYVLLTRGILGTHVYIENPELRRYFAKYFVEGGNMDVHAT